MLKLTGLALALLALACAGKPGRLSLPAPIEENASAERIAADVYWLADDARAGRRAGTPEALNAGRWLAGRFAEVGLEPAGEQGFLQPFDVPLEARDAGSSDLVIFVPADGGPEVLGEADVSPLFCAERGRVEGRLVFCGHGIENEELGWDDFEGLDLTGAIAFIVRGAPELPAETAQAGADVKPGDPHADPHAKLPADPHADPHGKLPADPQADPHAIPPGVVQGDPHSDPHADATAAPQKPGFGGSASILTKVMNAKRRGAVGVILAPATADEPLLRFDAGRGGRAGIPAIAIGSRAAEMLFPGWAKRKSSASERTREPERTVGVFADILREKGPAVNVLGRLRGEDPDRVVVVGAHYDHLGTGGSGSLAPGATDIHNGADDNASGTAVVLEIARLLKSGDRLPCDVVFALWSGEELGLLGSEYWAEHPTFPLDEVAANLNLDMVGRAGGGELQVLGAGTSTAFEPWMKGASELSGLELHVSTSGGALGGSSDHQTFIKRKIPALHLFSGLHADYHKPSDDSDKVETEGAAKVAVLGSMFVGAMAATEELPFVEPVADPKSAELPKGGFRAWFGSIPSYTFEGPGVKIDGASVGSPAERAGFIAGDVLRLMGDVKIENIYDLTYALQRYKPGDVVAVKFLRDEAEQETKVTLSSREMQ